MDQQENLDKECEELLKQVEEMIKRCDKMLEDFPPIIKETVKMSKENKKNGYGQTDPEMLGLAKILEICTKENSEEELKRLFGVE